MTKLELKEEKLGAKLKTYASGNGALSFVYVDSKGKATSDEVTLDDAKAHMSERKGHLNWIVGTFDSVAGPVAFCPMVRIGVDRIVKDGEIFRYFYSRTESFGLFLWVVDDLSLEIVHVKHISTKAAVRFWLDNEKRCVELQKEWGNSERTSHD